MLALMFAVSICSLARLPKLWFQASSPGSDDCRGKMQMLGGQTTISNRRFDFILALAFAQ
jgi:hypothetical protein